MNLIFHVILNAPVLVKVDMLGFSFQALLQNLWVAEQSPSYLRLLFSLRRACAWLILAKQTAIITLRYWLIYEADCNRNNRRGSTVIVGFFSVLERENF